MPTSPAQQDALAVATAAIARAFLALVEACVGPIADDVAHRLAANVRGISAGQVEAVQPSPFLTQREAAAYTGRSVSSIRRARQGGLCCAQVGGLVVFERAVLDAWMRGEAPARQDRGP